MEQKLEGEKPGIPHSHLDLIGEMRCPRKGKALRKADKATREPIGIETSKWEIHRRRLQKTQH